MGKSYAKNLRKFEELFEELKKEYQIFESKLNSNQFPQEAVDKHLEDIVDIKGLLGRKKALRKNLVQEAWVNLELYAAVRFIKAFPHVEKSPFGPLDQGTRQEVRERDKERCRKCGRSDLPLEVHHIVPRYMGGRNEPDNLILLCIICHRKEHSM